MASMPASSPRDFHPGRKRRRTVVFAVNVAHSVHLRDEFRRSGVLAERIDGATQAEVRDATLASLAAEKIAMVTNCQVLTEGWDCPEVSCIVLARPTKSLVLYRQMTDRTLRPAPGKIDSLVLDHAGAVFQHGFVDDPIVWTLHEDQRAENKAHGARGQYKAPALTTCPSAAQCVSRASHARSITGAGYELPQRARHRRFVTGAGRPSALPLFDDDTHKLVDCFPVVIAPIIGPDGELQSVQRIYIADVNPRKKPLPPVSTIKGAAVRLFDPENGTLGIAEGVETPLAAHTLFRVPVWSALSEGGMQAFEPPLEIRKLLVFADNDRIHVGQAAAYSLARRLSRDRKEIEVAIHVPAIDGTDFNDALKVRRA